MKTIDTGFVVLLLLVCGIEAIGQGNEELINAESGLAIDGYDPVAYFLSGKALEGKKEFTTQIGGVTCFQP